MKRMALGAFCLAALVSVALTWGVGRGGGFEVRAGGPRPNRDARPNTEGKPEIEFLKFISNSYHTYAVLKVTNGGPEAMLYPGYATNSNTMIFAKQDGLIRPAMSTHSTGNGFGAQSLPPGKTIIFDTQVPDGKGAFQIGFAYELGAEHDWKILWSEQIEPPPAGSDKD